MYVMISSQRAGKWRVRCGYATEFTWRARVLDADVPYSLRTVSRASPSLGFQASPKDRMKGFVVSIERRED